MFENVSELNVEKKKKKTKRLLWTINNGLWPAHGIYEKKNVTEGSTGAPALHNLCLLLSLSCHNTEGNLG